MEVSPTQRVAVSFAALGFAGVSLAFAHHNDAPPHIIAESRYVPVAEGPVYSAQQEMNDMRDQAHEAQLAAEQRAEKLAAERARALAEKQAAASRSRHIYAPKPHHVQITGNMVDDLAALRQCESGGNYKANTGNGYYGAYQFDLRTWRGAGFLRFAARPDLATPSEQDQATVIVQRARGWSPWPSCAKQLGLFTHHYVSQG